MKKQVNPSVKAHLIRGAFYLVLLIALCAIPFALAQRNVGYRNIMGSIVGAQDHSQLPKFPYSSFRERRSVKAVPAGEKTPTPTATASETPTASPSASETPTASPSASPTATATPGPGCGLLVGDGLAIGFAPNNYTLIASNIVNFTFSNSQNAPNDFAIFQTHDPFGSTIVEDAITAAGHTFGVFTPGDLAGFDFTQYRVIILNWDDHFVSDFLGDYTAAIPALEAYIAGGGVVWIQGAIQGEEAGEEDSYPLPFGGQSNFDLSSSDPIVDPSSPMVQGVPSPITGNFASQASDEDLPEDAHIVVVTCQDKNGGGENCDSKEGGEQNPVLYHLRRGASCEGTPTPTPSGSPSATATPSPSGTPTPTPSGTPTPSPTVTPTPTSTPGGCVRGQGFWKNHPDQWPVTQLQLGNTTYSEDQLLSIFHEPPRGNGLLILVHQEIAAKLNIANGADGSCIQQTLADADALIGDLVVPPIGDGFLQPQDVSPFVGLLGDFNEGDLCAPSCDDSSPSPSPSPRSTPRSRPPVHPRPGR
jgi:hypothetical protein